MMTDIVNKKAHWENIFETQNTSKVSWYEERPQTSLWLIEKYSKGKSESIIDVGGGDSRLSDALIELEYEKIAVLDISGKALKIAENRIGADGNKIFWIESNILDFVSNNDFDIWHDRAVFHFMNDSLEQKKYKEVVLKSIALHGILIMGTFSINNGPKKCSGLDVKQHDQHSIANLFYPEFELLENFESIHKTPSGVQQNFNWVVLKRKR